MTEAERTAPRGAHRPSRRAEVVEAAIRVFADQGLKASVAAVAEESGMSPASIYYHFPTKDDLLTAALKEVSDRISATTAAGGGAPRSIREAAQSVWDYQSEHAAETRLLYHWARTGPEPARAVREEFVAHHVNQSRRRMSKPERQTRLDLAVEELVSRTYVRLAMDLSLAWAAGSKIAGYRRKDLIVDALIRVGERLAGEPEGTADLRQKADDGAAGR
ncbi:TetR/AcrR family transcriptional regulator [Actinomadura sp. KC345]|uniref:TetR/AcrR family transcriptional regulator n=1 Tax=Actinomadura sp. KC345 TaxID=2530371 RepID=UPI00105293FC|nr:TetR/AcrR family transcriptional regulator [Actinomadura sp. KC345]TDC55500.1 TetR/AcrR family transcriptional regulator [Actinomadura sp. KC345]